MPSRDRNKGWKPILVREPIHAQLNAIRDKKDDQSFSDLFQTILSMIDVLKKPDETRADFVARVFASSLTTFVSPKSVEVKISTPSSVKTFIPMKSPTKSLVRPKVVREEN